MARFGQGINPALGATDYTGYLQGALRGAEMQAQGAAAIGQGISNLGQSLGGAMEKRSEQNKAFGAEIKSGFSTLKSIIDSQQFPDQIKAQAKTALESLKDPNLSKREQAAIASKVNQQFSAVVTAGLQTIMATQQQEAEDKRRQYQTAPLMPGAPYASTQARMAEAFNRGLPVSEASGIANALYPQAPQVDPLKEAQTLAQIQKLQAEIEKLRAETSAMGTPNPTEAERLKMERERLDIAKSEASSKAAEKQDAAQKENKRYLDEANFMLSDFQRQRQLLDQAEILIKGRGAGGTIEGLPFVRDVLAAGGADATQILDSIYNSLRSQERIGNMRQLKRLSPSGNTGFGNQSDKEGASLEQNYTEFRASLSEEEQLRRIKEARDRVDRLKFALIGDIEKAGGAASNQNDRFTIVPQ